MLVDPSLAGMLAFLAVFAGVAVLGFYLTVRARGDRRHLSERLRELGTVPLPPPDDARPARPARSLLEVVGGLVTPAGQGVAAQLRARLIRAGYARPSAAQYYLGLQLALLIAGAVGAGAVAYGVGRLPWTRTLLWAAAGGAAGFLAPSLGLAAQEAERRRRLRNALPDALDIFVLCLEGGASLNAAVNWVTEEIQTVHADLGGELAIVQGKMQLGLAAGEAFQTLAERCGLVEVQELASVLTQSERYGASVAKALRLFADTFRQDRQSRAEEMAQKAAVKILFPTLLCIFPAIFIVLLGPASFQMAKLFSR